MAFRPRFYSRVPFPVALLMMVFDIVFGAFTRAANEKRAAHDAWVAQCERNRQDCAWFEANGGSYGKPLKRCMKRMQLSSGHPYR